MKRLIARTAVSALVTLVGAPLAMGEVIDFSAISPGGSVEGAGTVHPLLTITTSVGNGIALFAGLLPSVYGGGPTSSVVNAGMLPTGGIGTNGSGFRQDFVFAFAQDVTFFSIRVLDYGDLNGGNATQHTFGIQAYDASNSLVDVDSFSYTSDNAQNPTSGSAGNLQSTGDSILSGTPPGNAVFTVTGAAITRVEMFYSHNGSRAAGTASDARIGMTGITIDFTAPVNVDPTSFGDVKSRYHD